MAMTVIKSGNRYNIGDQQNVQAFEILPVGTYAVKFDQMAGKFFLEQTGDLTNPSKLYGDTKKRATRIIQTFEDRPNQTGVLLSGEKGSGKTLLARQISIDLRSKEVPTVLVNEPHCGETFNQFVQSIDQPCLFIFDEFEKVYNEEQQESLLTLFDGVYPSKKLFVITVNDKYRINFAMRNRPGRLYYALEYKGLPEEFVREYCEDNSFPKDKTDQLVKLSNFFYSFNFDMLKAIVEECIRYDEMPSEVVDFVNASPEGDGRQKFIRKIYREGSSIDLTPKSHEFVNAAPLREYVHGMVEDYLDETNYHLDNDWNKEDIEAYKGEKVLISVLFDRDKLKEIREDGKTFIYKNGIYTMILERAKEENFDYRAF